MLRLLLGLFFTVVAPLEIAAAQIDSQNDGRRVQLDASEPERITEQDIVVTGMKLIEGDPPIPARQALFEAGSTRGMFMRAEMFARCADKPILRLLRNVVDGEASSSAQAYALDMLIRTNVGCYADFPRPTTSPPALGDCQGEFIGQLDIYTYENPDVIATIGTPRTCRAKYTRGAVVEQVLRTYAADFPLTRNSTWRNDVRQRFYQREQARNTKREPRDKLYFKVVTCLVGEQPELASHLLRSPPAGQLSGRIQETMFARAPHCVGYAKSVKSDPSEFRVYVADAVYRWTVAAKDVDSLLPG